MSEKSSRSAVAVVVFEITVGGALFTYGLWPVLGSHGGYLYLGLSLVGDYLTGVRSLRLTMQKLFEERSR